MFFFRGGGAQDPLSPHVDPRMNQTVRMPGFSHINVAFLKIWLTIYNNSSAIYCCYFKRVCVASIVTVSTFRLRLYAACDVWCSYVLSSHVLTSLTTDISMFCLSIMEEAIYS